MVALLCTLSGALEDEVDYVVVTLKFTNPNPSPGPNPNPDPSPRVRVS